MRTPARSPRAHMHQPNHCPGREKKKLLRRDSNPEPKARWDNTLANSPRFDSAHYFPGFSIWGFIEVFFSNTTEEIKQVLKPPELSLVAILRTKTRFVLCRYRPIVFYLICMWFFLTDYSLIVDSHPSIHSSLLGLLGFSFAPHIPHCITNLSWFSVEQVPHHSVASYLI